VLELFPEQSAPEKMFPRIAAFTYFFLYLKIIIYTIAYIMAVKFGPRRKAFMRRARRGIRLPNPYPSMKTNSYSGPIIRKKRVNRQNIKYNSVK